MVGSASDHPPTWKFDYVIFHPESRADLRAWLEVNHASEPGAWIASWRKETGRLAVSYAELCEELLCWGWIDSTVNTLDDDRLLNLATPRRPRSTWTRLNRRRIEEQAAAGRMTEAGWAAVEVAKANGWWTIYDPVEDLLEPDDLAEALDADTAARRAWDDFSASSRKAMLWWIYSAARQETRRNRVAMIVSKARTGEKAQG